MYEFYGWIRIAESAEEADAGTLAQGLTELDRLISEITWTTGSVEFKISNGEYSVLMLGVMNRYRDEAEELNSFLDYVIRRFPGAWGLLYERSDDFREPPGPGAFRVRVIARGKVVVRLDPFLSPFVPVIED